MKVKICGITNSDDALMCERFGVDALGFIFYHQSKRYVSPEAVKSISERLSPFTFKVGVFVNEQPEIINHIARLTKLNFVQLHGDESEDLISKIDFPIIQTIRVKSKTEFDDFTIPSDRTILLDTFSEKHHGGTGEKFDWSLIPSSFSNKIILSGGINVSDLEMIFNQIKPAAIDLSSSLESKPGKKDEDKVKIFLKTFHELRRTKC